MVAIPSKELGLTGVKGTKAMIKRQWNPFGVPSLITTDQGPHFISSWFKQICASLGIRQAYSHAYHHQSNGRAEVAGQQLMEILRKLQEEEQINWVDALPRTLRMIHDRKGITGLSPYEILFGRERPL